MATPLTISPAVQAIADALTAVFAGSVPPVAILDASDLTQVYESQSVTVGGTWDPDTGAMSATDAVLVDIVEHGAGRLPVETTRISCVAFSGSGDSALSQDRASMNAMLTTIRDAVRGLTAVGSSSAMATMATQQWAQIVDEQGSGVVATFEVTVMVLP